MRHRLTYAGFILIVGATALGAQVQNNNQGFPDVNESTLRGKYHITPDKDGLIRALQHPESGVRAFAAWKLADNKQNDALPAILTALMAETVPGARIGIALAAAKLGSSKGVSELKGMCAEPSWHPALRMVAATAVLNILGSEDCRQDVVDALRLENDTQTLIQALTVLPHFAKLTASELRAVQTAMPLLLRMGDPVVRSKTSQTIREMGDASGVQMLRAAIPLERDEVIRTNMEENLNILEKKLGIPSGSIK